MAASPVGCLGSVVNTQVVSFSRAMTHTGASSNIIVFHREEIGDVEYGASRFGASRHSSITDYVFERTVQNHIAHRQHQPWRRVHFGHQARLFPCPGSVASVAPMTKGPLRSTIVSAPKLSCAKIVISCVPDTSSVPDSSRVIVKM